MPRVETEIAADINPLIVNLLTCVRDAPGEVRKFIPVELNRAAYFESQAQCWAACPDERGRLSTKAQEAYAREIRQRGDWLRCGPELAAHTIVACSVGYNNRLYGKRVGDTGFSYREPERLRRRLVDLESCAARLEGVSVIEADGLEVMQEWDSPTTCFFVDPPYIPVSQGGGSRSDRATYGPGEAPDLDWHRTLIEVMDRCVGSVLLTVGEDSLYSVEMDRRGWSRVWTKAAPQRKRGSSVGHVGYVKQPLGARGRLTTLNMLV